MGQAARARICWRSRAPGVMWLNGDEDQGPVPFGLAIGDMLAGAAVRARHPRGAGAARHHRQGQPCRDQPAGSAGRFPVRGADHASQRRPPPAASARASAARMPICRRPTASIRPADGYLAIAMTPIAKLADLLSTRGACALSRQTGDAGSPRATTSRRSSRSGSRPRPSTNGWPSSNRPTSGAPRC